MNYKRKGHRGRHKKNTMDNQSSRVVGNSENKWGHGAGPRKAHRAKNVRNRIEEDDL